MECALWVESLEHDYSFDDFSVEARTKMIEDCRKFQAENMTILLAADASLPRHGHDFWLTRNGHGAGFWDRGYGDSGDKLTAAAKAFGSQDIYVGDDGKLEVT